jgi:AspT/YidE/YbjL antiporter-like protein
MSYVVTALRENPELAVFSTLAAGFLLGRIQIRSFKLGNVVGTLFAGLLIGQLGIDVPTTVKVVFFDLFLFATGYKVGPQFIRGLGRSALPQVALALVLCGTSLLLAVLAATLFDYDSGTAAGLIAGFTGSTIIGTAGDAISRLGLPRRRPIGCSTTSRSPRSDLHGGHRGIRWFLSGTPSPQGGSQAEGQAGGGSCSGVAPEGRPAHRHTGAGSSGPMRLTRGGGGAALPRWRLFRTGARLRRAH